ncbi:uncharacterized protein [Amphiura filiformis]|uniref:uncharacterized protein isoform X2 n=1 Tax=Amphiura filiformis TaxID=82378 RepID=UPI003B214FD7
MMASAPRLDRQLSHILPASSIELHNVIGKGGQSQVWRATYTGQLGQKIPVAAKKVPSRSIDDSEIKIMQKTEHKHIIKFYGVWKQNEHDVFIIMEYAERGDLRNFLDDCRKNNQRLTKECVWKWIYEAACALQYFKTLKLSHRDVKSLNFLIMDDYTLKLGDLGLATHLETTQKTQGKGTCNWMAPEVAQHQQRSPKSDIFSFGIVAWEIVTMGIPYAEHKGNYQVMKAVGEGERPIVPLDCPDVLRSLMTSCWDADRNERPDISEVCLRLLPYQCKVKEVVEPDIGGSRRYETVCDSEQTVAHGATSDVEMSSVSPLSSSGAKPFLASSHLQQGEDADMATMSTGSGGGQDVPMETGEVISGELHAETHELQGTSTRSGTVGSMPKSSSAATLGASYQVRHYHMRNKPHGICVIINNVDFGKARRLKDPEFKDRHGSDRDAENLKQLFEGLNYKVEVRTNLKQSAMYDILDSKRRTDHSKFDCFVCCVLTHGANSKLYGCDGTSIPILKLTQLFTADICRTLSGKPKLFIFESCLGIKRQGSSLEHDGLTEKETIPNESDFILGYATVPGHVAYRHTTEGSWYIGSLVETIRKAGTKYDILTLLTMVNKNMSTFVDEEGNKQTASVFNTLRKKMYLCESPEDTRLQTV